MARDEGNRRPLAGQGPGRDDGALTRRRRAVAWGAFGAAVLLGAALAGFRALPGRSAPTASGPSAAAASSSAATAPSPAPRLAAPEDQLYGGRTVAWWEHRLALLHARSDPEGRALYEATCRRAEAHGFRVEARADAVTLTLAGGPRAPEIAP